MPEYISIAEFAERAGVTRQSVYKRLDKELHPYVREADGRKTLDIAALEVYTPQNLCKADSRTTEDAVTVTTEATEVGCSTTEVDSSATSRFTAYLEKENDRLIRELADRDRLIAGYADRFAALAEREQEISARALQTTGQAQLLHANSQDEPERATKQNWFSRIFK